jgi:phospholipid/cholesterol/gamma-HCH transport system ATP-binding protein
MKTQVASIDSVRFKNLSIGYGQQALLSGITLDLPRGEVIRVKGTTGSGKSAVLKLAVGLLPAIAGEYFVNEEPVHNMSFEDFLPYRLNIGYSFDFGGLLSNRTLRENLALPLLYHKRMSPEEANERVEDVLFEYGLTTVADKRPSAVAGSQRKAGCVARAVVMKPQMLILDDPTTGMGAPAIQSLSTYINKSLKSGELRFIVVTSNDSNFCTTLKCKELEIQNQWLEWVA